MAPNTSPTIAMGLELQYNTTVNKYLVEAKYMVSALKLQSERTECVHVG